METETLNAFPRGTLYAMLSQAYQALPEIAERDRNSWREFDDFFFDRPVVLETCGFMSIAEGKPVGFITWDPRGLPEKVEIGHNCILPEYRGRGYGEAQLGEALARIRTRFPQTVRVMTGMGDFFLPARRMYESQGFVATGEEAPEECVIYRLELACVTDEPRA